MAKHPVPDAALDQHVIFLGKTRSGKTYAMRGLVERMLDDDRRVCIIDPKGDWWGIKSSASGKSAGYPVVIFGGDHADVPINDRSGAAIGELVATGNRPCVVDLSAMTIGERTRFYMDFAAAIFRHNKGPLWLVIDEVHNFAPQGRVMDPESSKMVHWSNRLASEGLGKGIHLVTGSQRPQKVHKDLVTSCETLVAMRVVHNLDRQAIKEWIDGTGDPENGKRVLAEQASMPRGEAWVWSPEIHFLERIAFPKIKTYDSMKPADAGTAAPSGWADVDLDEVRKKLDAAVQEAKANDPKELRKRIAQLEKDQAQKKPEADPAKLQAAVDRAVQQAQREADQEKKALQSKLNALIHKLSEIFTLSADSAEIAWAEKPNQQQPTTTRPPTVERIAPFHRDPNPYTRPVVTGADSGTLPVGERKILTACAQYPDGLAREQLAVLTGYKRSSRDAYIQRLQGKGYLDVSSLVRATAEGVAALGDFVPLPAGADLRDYWFARLPEGERIILQVLVEEYPNVIPRETLDERTPYKRSSRDAYLQRLKAKQLVELVGRGEVKASETLFD